MGRDVEMKRKGATVAMGVTRDDFEVLARNLADTINMARSAAAKDLADAISERDKNLSATIEAHLAKAMKAAKVGGRTAADDARVEQLALDVARALAQFYTAKRAT